MLTRFQGVYFHFYGYRLASRDDCYFGDQAIFSTLRAHDARTRRNYISRRMHTPISMRMILCGSCTVRMTKCSTLWGTYHELVAIPLSGC